MIGRLLRIAALLTALPLAFGEVRAEYIQQGPKLVGVDAVPPSYLGRSVSVSADGNTAIVGGYWDNVYQGAAWVYVRDAGVWSQQGGKLVGRGAGGPAEQGISVALSSDGNTAVVGGSMDSDFRGAVWIFVRNSGNWTQQGEKLVGTGYEDDRALEGYSAAISGDGNTVVFGGRSGAWVFMRSGETWAQQGDKLVGAGQIGLQSVALSRDGNTLALGSGSNGTWVFTRVGEAWVQQGDRLEGAGAVGSTAQGASVALSADGNTLAVGGPGDENYRGAVWVFTRTGGVWSQQGGKLSGLDAAPNPFDAVFQGSGVTLSADGNTLVFGGPTDADGPGALWVFARSNGSWTQQGPKLVGTDGFGLGSSVSTSVDAGTILGGGVSDNNNNGAAWVFATANRSPDCSRASATPSRILSRNGRFVPVSIAGVTDADGDPVHITVSRVTQDEPLIARGPGDDDGDEGAISVGGIRNDLAGHADPSAEDVTGHGCPDAVLDSDGSVSVRAERSGRGNGRVYTLWFTASDGRGGRCDGSVRVEVPHDDHHLACVDDGQNVNSLGPCPESGRGDERIAATITGGVYRGDVATLQYLLPTASDVHIAIYDISGRRVQTFDSVAQGAGSHGVRWNISSLANGMYYCRLRTAEATVTKSLLILR